MKRKLLSRSQKADCLFAAAYNYDVKAKPKNLDGGEKARFKANAAQLRDEAYRHLDASMVHGDKMTTRITGNQAAKE